MLEETVAGMRGEGERSNKRPMWWSRLDMMMATTGGTGGNEKGQFGML